MARGLGLPGSVRPFLRLPVAFLGRCRGVGVPGGESGPFPGSAFFPLLRQAGRLRFAARKPGPGSFVWPYRATNPARASAKTVSLRGGTIPARARCHAFISASFCRYRQMIPQVIPIPAGHDRIRSAAPILAESIPGIPPRPPFFPPPRSGVDRGRKIPDTRSSAGASWPYVAARALPSIPALPPWPSPGCFIPAR